ncbi:MAG: Protein-glutamate methylesterase, partial [Verrucomicrobiaceae bacterium]|nr:Protein-glutamate methylesterase [Verrucomicrobiaceae bacterium]
GFYTKTQVEDVSPARLRRFFVEGDGGYRINKTLRSMCVFARHNFIGDPPFSRIDLVSCRNVLIYLTGSLQKKAFSLFHYALRQQGLLFLGTSESVGGSNELFEAFDKKHKIFSKNPIPTPRIGMHFSPTHASMQRAPQLGQRNDPSPPGLNAQREADRVVLNRSAPAGVLLDDRLHIVQFRGDTSSFLKPPVGTATHQVLKMSRQGLVQPLQAALEQARTSNAPVRTDNVQIHGQDEPLTFSLEVIPLRNTNEPYFLVLFDQGQLRPPERLGRDFSPESSEVSALMARVRELERELAEAQDGTQALQENYEFIHEELQASNEEVQSANEELQSSNEELETSKEELESTNEELTTLNEEMASRNTDLNRLVNDLNNLHVSINTGIVLLGRDLTIRSFTPIAGRAFNLLNTDIGTPLNRLRHSINCPDLENIIGEVIDSLTMQERQVQDDKGHSYSLRIRPYMTMDNRIDGAVLVMMDIEKQMEAIRLSETRFRRFFEAAQDGILIVDPETHKVIEANPYVERLLGLSHDEVGGKEVGELDIIPNREACTEAIAKLENIGVLRTECPNVKTGKGAIIHLELVCNLHREGDHFVLQCNIRDITARRQAEEARIQMEAIVSSSQDAIISKNSEGIVQSWNPAAEKLFGYTAAEMIGQSILKIIPPELQQEEAAIIAKIRKGEPIEHYSTVRAKKDGTRIQVMLTISPVRNADGVVVGASKILRDMTEQLRSEREHLATNQRLQALMNALPIGVSFSDDATCERITGNAAVLEQFEASEAGNSSASAAETHVPGRNVRIFKDGREVSHDELPLQLAVRENRAIPPLEYEVLLPSGRRWIMEASGAPMRDAEGKVIAGVSVTEDITQRKLVEEALKESEERFRTMADAAPVLIWVSGTNKVCDYFNKAWLDFTGRTLQEEIDDGWKSSIHPDDKVRVIEVYEGAFDARASFESECRLLHHSGMYRWVLGRGVARIGPDGTFNGYMGACVDIHDQKMATQAISLAHEAAELANRAKDQFLAALSHELRTPLSPVLLLCSEMEEAEDLPPKVREDFAMIRRNVELEARLIDDLLDITRITEGKLSLNFEPLHTGPLMEQTIEILRGDIDDKHLTIALDLVAPDPAVKGDPVRLQQVLWNVLKNAVKFTPLNGHISVKTQVEEDGLRISIADNGIGITASEMPRIFNAFSQGDQAMESRFGGLGLGLSISSLLMQEHRGRIWAESEGRGKGAVFHVALPLATEQVVKGSGGTPKAAPLPHLRVLLVEDHSASRDTLTRLLKRRGHHVAYADCIAGAHKLAEEEQFDIVISDLGLPDGSGHDLMFDLHRKHRLRGIALSGYGTSADVQRSADAGFLEHLTKPVDIRKLDAALARAFAVHDKP